METPAPVPQVAAFSTSIFPQSKVCGLVPAPHCHAEFELTVSMVSPDAIPESKTNFIFSKFDMAHAPLFLFLICSVFPVVTSAAPFPLRPPDRNAKPAIEGCVPFKMIVLFVAFPFAENPP